MDNMLATLALGLGLCFSGACSDSGDAVVDGSDSGSGNQSGTCSNAPDCALVMPVSGGVSGDLAGVCYCGCEGCPKETNSPNQTMTFDLAENLFENMVSIDFGASFPVEQTGSFPVIVEIGHGFTQTWETPPGACTVTITSNALEPNPSGGFVFYDVGGTGTCSQPASSTTADPITIGNFTFAGKFSSD
jgi:hypothetical protein